jgi:hypothetical protein
MAYYVFSHLTSGFSLRVNVQDNRGCNFAVSHGGTNYSGNVHWTLAAGVLEIHEISAAPERQGLGALLMWVTARRAIKLGLGHVATLATAQSAYKFYLDMNLHPSPDDITHANNLLPLAIRPSVNDDAKEEFAIRVLLGRMATATWSGESALVAEAAFVAVVRNWMLVDFDEA